MPHQEALSVVATLEPSRRSALEQTLTGMRADPGHNTLVPFAKLPNCHFGRVFCWDTMSDPQGNVLPPQLLLLADCDGSSDVFLADLVNVAGEGLDGVFGHCTDYPSNPSAATRLDYLKNHRVKERAHYAHRPGRSVEQIKQEAELRVAVDEFLAHLDAEDSSALQVRERVRAFVSAHPKLSSLIEPAPSTELGYRVRQTLDRVLRPLLVLLLGPVLTPVTSVGVLLIRLQELKENARHVRPERDHLDRLTVLEDHSAHNAYAAGGFVKPGALRRAAIDSVLQLVDYGVRHLFNEDSLAGVKSIHFARWVPMPNRRMIFTSNFDGSVESYNDDFINLLGWGLNLVFSNGEAYPPTRWLIFGGANYEEHFKDHLRRHQIPVQVAYSAYPTLSARNIENNAALRAGLSGNPSEEEAQAWLRLR